MTSYFRGVQSIVTKCDDGGRGVFFPPKSCDVIYGRPHIPNSLSVGLAFIAGFTIVMLPNNIGSSCINENNDNDEVSQVIPVLRLAII